MAFEVDPFTSKLGRLSEFEKARDTIRDHKLSKPVVLLIPVLYKSDGVEKKKGKIKLRDSLENIVDVLLGVDYLKQVTFGLDGAVTRAELDTFEKLTRPVPNRRIIWNGSAGIKKVYADMKKAGDNLIAGKGRNLYTMLLDRYVKMNKSAVILHDSDITSDSYGRRIDGERCERIILSLAYPLVNPEINFDYVKAYYDRIATDPEGNRFFTGRVNRLLVGPVIQALEKSTLGEDRAVRDYSTFLSAIKYALAGEFGLSPELANRIVIQPDWAIEIGILNYLYQSGYDIAQVDEEIYDHKHQKLSPDNPKKGLFKMGIDISKSIFRELEAIGCSKILDPVHFATFLTLYRKIARDTVQKTHQISKYQGLKSKADDDSVCVDTFHEGLKIGHDVYLKKRHILRGLPSPRNTRSEFRERIADTVDRYN